MIGNDKVNFPNRLSLIDRWVASLRKVFASKLPAKRRFSKTQLLKMIQSAGFLGRLNGPLMKVGLPLMKNVLNPLGKYVLIPLLLIIIWRNNIKFWTITKRCH